MKNIKKTIKLWINNRFIIIIEVIGYSVSAILGMAAIYCIVTYENMNAYANGILVPSSTSINVNQEYLIYDWVVNPGDLVESETPIAKIVTDKTAFQRLIASSYLSEAIKSLKDTEIPLNQNLETLKTQYNKIRGLPEIKNISSEKRGIISIPNNIKKNTVLNPETDLAITYDLNTLFCSAELEASNSGKVTEGQTVTIILPETEQEIIGLVNKDPDAKEGGTVKLIFSNIPENAKQYFKELLSSDSSSFPKVRATIIVGRRSLFAKFFGRSF